MKIKDALLILLFICFLGCISNTNKEIKHLHNAHESMVYIPKGVINKDKTTISIDSFWMDETEVTNAQFKFFIEETGYITIAERPVLWEELSKNLPLNTPKPHDSLLQPGALVFKQTKTLVSLNNPSLWWHYTIGANWKHPNGSADNLEGKENHPVVNVAWEDAISYAKWAKKRLPTEVEWEWASRGGIENAVYPWGDDNINKGIIKANYWQGVFPFKNKLNDGYMYTSPVKTYPANNYGLYDMAGNVWELCHDWFSTNEKVIKGGSFLCNNSYCSGYKISKRMGATPDTGLSHTGFRCVTSIPITQ